MLLELLQKGYGKAMGLNCASCRRRHLKLPAALAAVWAQARPVVLLPVRAWY